MSNESWLGLTLSIEPIEERGSGGAAGGAPVVKVVVNNFVGHGEAVTLQGSENEKAASHKHVATESEGANYILCAPRINSLLGIARSDMTRLLDRFGACVISWTRKKKTSEFSLMKFSLS